MPVCFQLIPKDEREPRKLQLIDDMMREHFKAPADAERWFRDWYDSIGFRLACGKTFAQVREEFQGYTEKTGEDPNEVRFYQELIEVVDYLREIYDTNSFRENKY